jgi:hypothetical protein
MRNITHNGRTPKILSPAALALSGVLFLLLLTVGGCGFLAMATHNVVGSKVAASYAGLAKHSVAILVYSDDATTFMYPQARREVSSFLTQQLEKHLPTARLLDYHRVLAYQNGDPNWEALPIKTIGRHFSVDRVIYIELIDYSAHAPGEQRLLRGHIKANVYVYDTHLPGDGRVFSTTLNVYWPRNAPEPVFDSDANLVRMNTLTRFSRDVARCFYNWRYYGSAPHG